MSKQSETKKNQKRLNEMDWVHRTQATKESFHKRIEAETCFFFCPHCGAAIRTGGA